MPRRPRSYKLLLSLTLLAALAVATYHYADPQRLRAQLERVASDSVGKPVRLRGPLAWSLRHGPGLDARQVVLLNPGWASDETFASADRVHLALSWSELLRGRLAIDRLDLSGLQVALESGDDRNNWQFSPRTKGGGAPFQAAISATGLSISYRNGADRSEVHLPKLILSGGAADTPLQLSTALPEPLVGATLVLQGPPLPALIADPRRWKLTGGVQAGANGLSGELDVDLSGPRPSLGGQLTLAFAGADDGAVNSGTNPVDKHQTAAFSGLVKALRTVDANIDINTQTRPWNGHIGLTLEDGRLELKTLDDPQPTGLLLQVDVSQPAPTLQAKAEMGPTDLRALIAMTGFDIDMPLSAQGLSLDLRSSGKTANALLAGLRGELTITALNKLPELGDLQASQIELQQTDKGLAIKVTGTWGGENFTVTTEGGSLQQLLDSRADYPFQERFRLGDNQFKFNGYFQRQADKRGQAGPQGQLQLSGDDPSQLNLLLSSLSAISLPEGLKYRISAELGSHQDDLELRQLRADIDGLKINGTLHYGISADSGVPLLSGKLSIPRLSRHNHRKASLKAKAAWYDSPLPALPTAWQADIDLHIGRLTELDPAGKNLRTTIKLRHNELTLSPLRLEIAEQRVSGQASYRHQPGKARFELSLKTPAFDLQLNDSAMLEGDQLSFKGSKGFVKLSATGDTPGQWLDNLRMDSQLKTSTLTISNPQGQRLSRIALSRPRLSRAPGKPFLLRASGSQDGDKITLKGRLSPARGSAPPRFDVALSAGDLQAAIDGELTTKAKLQLAKLNFEISASQPVTLPLVLRNTLTRRGPFLFKGHLTSNGDNYRIQDLQLLAGANDLKGGIALDLGSQPHKLTVTMKSGHLQPQLRATPTPQAGQPASQSDATNHAQVAHVIPNTHLVPRVPRDWDADYNIAIDELDLGDNRLSNVQLRAKLRQQRLLVEPIRGVLNGKGSLSAKVDARLVDGQLQAHVSAQIQRLNLGRLLTRGDLDVVVPWYTGIDLSLDGKGNYLRSFLADANGGIRFIGGHMDLDTSIMDLWTLDLISIAMPDLLKTKGKDLGLLCSVAGFRIKDGIMTSEGMLFDTAHAIVRGSGTISLRDERLKLLLSPKKKRLSLFNITTPVALTGSLSEPEAHVPPEQLAITAGGLALKVMQPWVLAGGVLTSGYRGDKPCLSTLQDISSKGGVDKPGSLDSPLDDALREVGSGAQRLLD